MEMNITFEPVYIITVIAIVRIATQFDVHKRIKCNKVFFTVLVGVTVAAFHLFSRYSQPEFSLGAFCESYVMNLAAATSFYDWFMKWILQMFNSKTQS